MEAWSVIFTGIVCVLCEVLNPQMAQIDADGEKDKQPAQELKRPCLASVRQV
jgi:hypothetical protein